MGIGIVVIPRATDADNVTLELHANRLRIREAYEMAKIIDTTARKQIEIIELQARAKLPEVVPIISKNEMIPETFSKFNGYNNYVDSATAIHASLGFTPDHDLQTLTQSQITTTASCGFFRNTNELRTGTRFTATSDFNLGKVELTLQKNGTPNFDFFLELREQSANVPSKLLGTSNIINASTLNPALTVTPFYFRGIPISNGTSYWIVLRKVDDGRFDPTNHIISYYNHVGLGGISQWNGNLWSTVEGGLWFRLYEGENPLPSQVNFNLPPISGNVTHTTLIVNAEREAGDSITYDLTDGVDIEADNPIDTKNGLMVLTSNPTNLTINLTPKAINPTVGFPIIYSMCLILWKE